jgi:hemolysin D
VDNFFWVKLAAYSFQKYGMLDGVVRQVGADAQENLNSGGSRNLQDALVNAEIHLGTRSVVEYLLSPIQKVAQEAGREQ